jgi:2',3'-cyclic-nucleotide 2'-phosphodiesterase (5'-nucleotidase family)
LAYSPNSQVALINGGTVRATLPIGEVSRADVLTAFPFEDFVYRAKISGRDLATVLELSVKDLGFGPSGRFLQVAGLRLTYVGHGGDWRLETALVQDGPNWIPLDPKAEYDLVTIDFLAHGGDGYEPLKLLDWTMTDQLISDVFIHYFLKGPIMADFDPRITFIPK